MDDGSRKPYKNIKIIRHTTANQEVKSKMELIQQALFVLDFGTKFLYPKSKSCLFIISLLDMT